METFRDLALADYENWEDEVKVVVQDDFNNMVANGCDFSEIFQNYSLLKPDSPDEWLETCEIYKKPRLDFDEYITLKYIFANAETVIICKGCSLLISGKAYFTCSECFFDFSNGRSYNLCCDCYRTKNFKDHHHRVFSCIHSMTHHSRMKLARNWKESDQERRDEFIDGALIEFGKYFMEFAESITSDPDGWTKRFGKLSGKMSDTEEEDNPSMSRPKPQEPRNRFVVDLLGLTPTDNTSTRISNN